MCCIPFHPIDCCCANEIFFCPKVVVFKDIDYSELVRVEMRRPRKIGENPVLGSVEFEVTSEGC